MSFNNPLQPVYCLLLVFLTVFPSTLIAQSSGDSLLSDSKISPFENVVITELNFKNTEIKDVVSLIATKYNLNILVDDDIHRRLTLHLANITAADALKFIVEDNDLMLKKYGSIYKIENPPIPEPLPPPEKKWNISYENNLLSVDFKEEDLKEALYQISKITGFTILTDRYVSGQISGLIQNMPFEEALQKLLKNYGYHFQKDGEVYQVRRIGIQPFSENAAGGNFWINVSNGLLDIEVVNVPLAQVIDEISRQMNINLFRYGELKGEVTAQANGLSLEQCFNLVLSGSEYTYRKSGDIYLIGDKKNRLMVSSSLVKLNHLKVDGIVEMLPQKFINEVEFRMIKEHNALMVNGTQDVISEVEQIIREIDKPIPQILIEALVVDYNYQDIRDISIEAGLQGGANYDSSSGSGELWFPGIDIFWDGNTANKYLNKAGDFLGLANIGRLPENFYLKVKAMESVGKANIRSKPQIATLNGHEADISIGQTQYYKLITKTPLRDPTQVYIQETEQFQTIEANISLKITPWVSASGEITVEIHPEFNNPVGQLSPEIPPTIQSRALNSTVRLQDGETIVLGGLIQSTDSENISRLPILGSLPVIGRIFQSKNHNKSKSELIIYITPHLHFGNELIIDK